MGNMRCIAVDWSGNARLSAQREHIWVAEGEQGRLVQLENGQTQDEVVDWLSAQIRLTSHFGSGLVGCKTVEGSSQPLVDVDLEGRLFVGMLDFDYSDVHSTDLLNSLFQKVSTGRMGIKLPRQCQTEQSVFHIVTMPEFMLGKDAGESGWRSPIRSQPFPVTM